MDNTLTVTSAPQAQPDDLNAAIARGRRRGEQLLETGQDASARVNEAAGRADSKIDNLEKTSEGILPPPPQMIPPPKPVETNPAQQWGSMAMIVAALGSLLTRTPATTALNAAAAVMNGYKAKDQAATNQAYKQWEAATKNLQEIHDYQMDVYKSIMDKINRSEGEADKEFNRDTKADMAAFTVQARAFGDENAAMTAETHGVLAAQDLIDKRQAAMTKMQEAGIKLTEAHNYTNAYNEWLQDPKGGLHATDNEKLAYSVRLAAEVSPTYEKTKEATEANDKIASTIAQSIADGKQPPATTGLYHLAGPVREKLAEQGVDLTSLQLDYQRAQADVRALNSPQMLRFTALGKSVVNTISEVQSLSHQLNMGGVPAVNNLELQGYVQTQGNTPKGQLASRYLAAVNTLKEEFANLASGGYAPHESAWALTNQQINQNYGRDQLDASLVEIQRLINYRLDAVTNLATRGPGAHNAYFGQEDLSGAAGNGTTNNPGAGGDEVAAPSGSGGQGAPTINSKEEYDELPSGAVYTAPDGSVRTKP